MRRAILRYADLRGANLWGADLRRGFMKGAQMQGANLKYAKLQRALMKEVNFEGAIWVNGKKCEKGSIGMCLQ
jgi:uncharacterized protein YjbI with pentapeptide repeats